MTLKPIWQWCRKQWIRFDQQIWLPGLIRVVQCLKGPIDKRIHRYNLLHDWKQAAVDDFSEWLSNLEENAEETKSSEMDACDLFRLMSEFTALRQEIRIQNREQSKTLSTLTGFLDAYQETSDRFQKTSEMFKDRSRSLAGLEENIRNACEKRTILPFLEVRDALVRGYEACVRVSRTKSLFRPPPKGIDGILEGYEMALRRIDRALSLSHVKPVEALGKVFDSKTMKAVDKRVADEAEKGLVVEEILTGFMRDTEVLRTAEVIVGE
jgi:molecular chaperone GrpE (heat shock protein)